MIGIGTDIVSVKRFKGIEKKHLMLRRMFTNREIAYALSKAMCAEVFAGHFAAKEALIKAFSAFGKVVLLENIEISHLSNGQPKAFIKKVRGYIISVSIAHEKDYATACALVIKKPL